MTTMVQILLMRVLVNDRTVYFLTFIKELVGQANIIHLSVELKRSVISSELK